MPTVLIPLLLAADQISKLLALRFLDPIPDRLLPGLYLTLVHNTGVAFGLFQGNPTLLGVFSLFVGFGLLVWLARARTAPLLTLALSLVTAGALGNAIDRLGRGWVVDFLDIGPGLWPVFNLADSFVVVGVLLLLLPWGRARS
jgi:signal peptidase II